MFCSIYEYTVSTSVLRNESLSTGNHHMLFKVLASEILFDANNKSTIYSASVPGAQDLKHRAMLLTRRQV